MLRFPQLCKTQGRQGFCVINAKWIWRQFEAGNGTRRGLAAALGVDAGVVSRMLHGRRVIKAHEIPIILDYFGVSVPAVSSEGDSAFPQFPLGIGEGDHTEAWFRLIDRLSELTDEELDYLSIAAEGLVARRNQAADKE